MGEEKEEGSEQEEESSEDEEYTDSEEEDMGPRLKPVFVRKCVFVILVLIHFSRGFSITFRGGAMCIFYGQND